jgi:predicted transcriptional regulator
MSKDQNATLARRHQELLQLVEAKGQMSVDELAHHFGVSDDTIRLHRETPFLISRQCSCRRIRPEQARSKKPSCPIPQPYQNAYAAP